MTHSSNFQSESGRSFHQPSIAMPQTEIHSAWLNTDPLDREPSMSFRLPATKIWINENKSTINHNRTISDPAYQISMSILSCSDDEYTDKDIERPSSKKNLLMYMIKCHVLIYLGYHPTTTARHKNTVYSALNKNMSKAFSFNCCLYCWKGGRVVI